MGSFDPPRTTHFPGLRENLYGRFTVNLGAYVPEVAEKHGSGAAKQLVREYNCCIRWRLGELGAERQDVWWSIEHHEIVVQDLLPWICHDAMLFFSRYGSRAAILAELEGKGEYVGSPARIICAIICVHRGELQRARDLLNQQSKDTHNPGHPAYVRALAERLGVGPLE